MRIARHVTPALVLVLLPTARVADRASDDPPSRVGRLSYLAGSVSFRPGSVEDWAAATINYPLTTGDRVWTDAGARAEVTIGSSAIRLGSQSAFGFLALDDRTTQVRLGQGSVEVRVRSLDADDVFEIDTPTGAVSLLRPGSYRLDVDSTGDTTTVTVRHGEAEVTAAGSAFAVRPGQAAVVSGVNAPSYDIHDALPLDNWEEWCTRRDRRWDDSRSARYVSRDMVGYEDLDVNGEWRTTDAYGAVWVPRTVVAGWAPYRYGHWAWVDPWGWTWIDDAPWGFAPFHYGRWVYVDGGWGWVPGRVVAERPVYAPALVAFVGGSHWSVSLTIGGGGVAWFPLAPEEPYVPAYHVSNNYVRNVNVTNVTNVTTITNVTNVNNVTNNVTNVNVTNVNVTTINYKNREVPGAVTGVSHDDFVAAKPVGQSAVVVSRAQLASATVVGTAPTVVPTRQSVLAEPGEKNVGRPPVAVTERSVVARATPPPPPVPFAARETALKEHPGRPVDDATLATLRERAPAAQPKLLVRPATPVTQAGATPAPALKPAREGLPAPRSLPATGFAPRREATPSPAAEPRGGRAAPAPAPAAPNAAANPPTGAGPGGKPDAAKPGRPGAGNTPPAEAERAHPGERPQPGARGQPPAERPQPAAQAQPPDRAQPPARPQPGERPQPAAQAQPGERAQPPGRPQPGERPQPAAQAQPGERPQPAGRAQPGERPQPTAQPQPPERPQPGARPQPGERPQPTAQPQPPERPQPGARPQPGERPQPAAQAQPAERPQPAARGQPPSERPQPAAQPQPAGRPAPAQPQQPGARGQPAAQPQPAGRPAPAQPQQPAAQPQPAGRPAPTQPQQPAARPQAPPSERQPPKAQKADTAKEKAKPKPD